MSVYGNECTKYKNIIGFVGVTSCADWYRKLENQVTYRQVQ